MKFISYRDLKLAKTFRKPNEKNVRKIRKDIKKAARSLKRESNVEKIVGAEGNKVKTNYDLYMEERIKNLSPEGKISHEVFGEYYKEEAEKLQREIDERDQCEQDERHREQLYEHDRGRERDMREERQDRDYERARDARKDNPKE